MWEDGGEEIRREEGRREEIGWVGVALHATPIRRQLSATVQGVLNER
jgi:hypothetical protein